MPTDSPARRAATAGVLCALAVALSYLENLLPALPVPGAKWGLGNLAVMAALYLCGAPTAATVTFVKAGFAFLRGPVAGAFSLAGGALALLSMLLLRRAPENKISPIGVGIAGGVTHNIGQLIAASAFYTTALFWYAPWLILTGGLCGALTGAVTRALMPKLRTILKERTTHT